MIIYVQRDEQGNIKGVFQQKQPGYAEEAMDAEHPDVQAFLAGI